MKILCDFKFNNFLYRKYTIKLEDDYEQDSIKRVLAFDYNDYYDRSLNKLEYEVLMESCERYLKYYHAYKDSEPLVNLTLVQTWYDQLSQFEARLIKQFQHHQDQRKLWYQLILRPTLFTVGAIGMLLLSPHLQWFLDTIQSWLIIVILFTWAASVFLTTWAGARTLFDTYEFVKKYVVVKLKFQNQYQFDGNLVSKQK